MDETNLIGLFWRRSEDAIRQAALRYGRTLQTLAERITGNSQDAQECVNDTYLAAWNSIPPACPRSLYAYLAKICRNTAFDLLDKQKAEKRSAVIVELSQELQQCIPDRMAEARMESRLIGHALNRFLGTLKQEDRVIFLRRYWFGDRVTEIAGALGVTENKVKVRLYRVRERLRTFLEQEGIDYA